MKHFLLFIVLTTFSNSFGQKIEKELYLKHSLKQDGESYQFTVLDDDKKGIVCFDKAKFYHWYKAQKVMITQGGASGQLLNGKFESFYENKQLSKKGSFQKGLKQGEWLYWRTDGSLIRTEHWRKGKKVGEENIYDEKGLVVTAYDYKCRTFSKQTKDSLIVSNYSGTKKAVSIFDKDGILVSKKEYKKGVEVVRKEKEVKTTKKKFTFFKKKDSAVDKPKKSETKPSVNNSTQQSNQKKEKKNWFAFLKKKENKKESSSKK